MLKELTVVVGGQIYAPEILDQKNIFIEGGKIKKISTDKPPNHAKIINADCARLRHEFPVQSCV